MWSDNETTVDLLGFDALADELEVLLTDINLLPLTVLVNGEWGSGKSSLMKVMKERLENDESEGKFIVVEFSPWRFEDFEFAKVALMAAVVDAISVHIAQEPEGEHRTKLLAKLNKVRLALGKFGVVKAAAMLGMAHLGMDPQMLVLAGAAGDLAGNAGAPPATPSADDGGNEDKTTVQRAFDSVAEFHVVFEELIEELGDAVRAVVVFIDDMDRCSNTETVVEMFEAMRLFLHAPKTAYVVGAQAASVERALNRGYLGRGEETDPAGEEWLEKMLQQRITIPPLGEPDVVTYVNLLFCQLHLRDDHEKFAELLERVRGQRRKHPFGIAFQRDMLGAEPGSIPANLVEQLDIADQIGPVLAQGLRGNPRQTKSFLNDLLRRLATAQRRGMDVDADKLAKLMVLEPSRHANEYRTLATWFVEADGGAPDQLKDAEKYAKDGDASACPDDVQAWAEVPYVSRWLSIQPDLAGINLGPYFTFSRGRVAELISAPELSAQQQDVLDAMVSQVLFRRRSGVKGALALPAESFNQLLPRLSGAMAKDPSGPAADSMLEVAKTNASARDAVFDRLKAIPVERINDVFINNLGTALPHEPRTRAFLRECVKDERLKKPAQRVLNKLEKP